MSRITLLITAVLPGLLLAGCVGPDTGAEDWERDAETGVEWRPLTPDEMDQWHLEGYQRAYVFRIPGLIADLREEEGSIHFPVRVYGGFQEAHLTFEEERHHTIEGDDPREQTSRRFTVASPWSHAWLVLPDTFRLGGDSPTNWRYTIDTPFDEWELGADIRPDDLITRGTSPCAEWSSGGHNGTAACIRHEEVEGY